jgi:hypothetical protein
MKLLICFEHTVLQYNKSASMSGSLRSNSGNTSDDEEFFVMSVD